MQQLTLQLITAFLGLSIGSYTDFKTREVPDWVNYGLIMLGFAINTIYSLVFSSWSYFLYSILGFGLCLIISLIMFYTGQWGGGDSKMLMALGAFIGFRLTLKDEFLLSLFINMIIIGGFYGLVWSFGLMLRNFSQVHAAWKKFLLNKDAVKIKNLLFVIISLLIVFAVIMRNNLLFLYIASVSIFTVLTFYLWIFIRSIENVSMIKKVSPNKLTEGDWIAKEVKLKGKYLCGPKDLGISKNQIKELKKLYSLGKIKTVVVKNGIPFVPSFWIAFVLTFLFGNLLSFIL